MRRSTGGHVVRRKQLADLRSATNLNVMPGSASRCFRTAILAGLLTGRLQNAAPTLSSYLSRSCELCLVDAPACPSTPALVHMNRQALDCHCQGQLLGPPHCAPKIFLPTPETATFEGAQISTSHRLASEHVWARLRPRGGSLVDMQ